MPKSYFAAVVVLLVAAPALAQTLTVRDKATLLPLADVAVLSPAGQALALTDANGQADLAPLAAYDALTLRRTGYQALAITRAQLAASGYRLLLTEATHSLDEVVVSASKFEEKRADVPQQIESLNARQLAFLNQSTVADALQQTGNVLVQKSQQGGGSPVMRGFEANKLLIVVDGVRMNNAIFRGGHLQNVLRFDNATFERAEIVFGPGSVVYGSDALGGVMHFHTRDPQLNGDFSKTNRPLLSGNAFARFGSANRERTQHLDLNVGMGKVGFLTSFTATDFGELRQGAQRNAAMGTLGLRPFYAARTVAQPGAPAQDVAVPNPDPNEQPGTAYRQYDFLQKILFRPNAATAHTLNFQYSTTSDVPRTDRLSEVTNQNLPVFARWDYGPEKRLLLSYKLELTRKTMLYDQLRVVAAWQDLEESRITRRFNNNNQDSRAERVGVYSLNADLSKQLGRHELRYGAELTHNDVQSTAWRTNVVTGAVSPVSTRYPDGGSTMRSLAAYLTHTWEISPQLILTDGIRYSNVRLESRFVERSFLPSPFNDLTQFTQQSGALNGNLGLVYQPGAAWRFTILGSSGFRAPNVDDVAKVFESASGTATRPGTLVIPNPGLRPEFTYNAELGVSKLVAGKVRLEGTGFYTWYENAITLRPTTLNGQRTVTYGGFPADVVSSQNAARAYLVGYSLSLRADLSPALSVSSALNYTYARIRTDSVAVPLDHIPPLFGRTGVTLILPRFRGEFFALYNGWKRIADYSSSGEDNQQYATPAGMPAWYTLNARASYQLNPHVQLQAAVENILDRNYRVFASGISGAGRHLSLTLRGRF